MASVARQLVVDRSADDVWDAVRDVGAIHTRLAPGFVRNTVYENGVRTVTFGNGATLVEPIVSVDDVRRRLVWTARGGITRHYNASMQVRNDRGRARIIWIADFLPDDAAPAIDAAMRAGLAAIGTHLGGIAR